VQIQQQYIFNAQRYSAYYLIAHDILGTEEVVLHDSQAHMNRCNGSDWTRGGRTGRGARSALETSGRLETVLTVEFVEDVFC
jgi:hypothetical protein